MTRRGPYVENLEDGLTVKGFWFRLLKERLNFVEIVSDVPRSIRHVVKTETVVGEKVPTGNYLV